MRIILIGFGTVGRALAKILHDEREWLIKTYGFDPQVIAIADSQGLCHDEHGLDLALAMKTKQKYGTIQKYPGKGERKTDESETIPRSEAEVLVETTPSNFETGQPGISNIKQALTTGKHVVTANKGPLALAMPALLELASHKKLQLRFSGTVGGGTPFLSFASKCLPGERIREIHGILNGTTNFILSKMEEKALPFQKALAQAQKKGYAEKDPTNDIKGFDTAAKIVIIANLVMKQRISLTDMTITGITQVTPAQIKKSHSLGKRVKLIGRFMASRATVRPEDVAWDDPVCVGRTLNALTFQAEHAGPITLVGQGAGGEQTASAILRDLVDIRSEYSVQERDALKLVMKFGGSSLANAAKIMDETRIVQGFSGENKIIVVVSAMNDVTDRLVEMGDFAEKGEAAKARNILSKVEGLHSKTARKVSKRGLSRQLDARIGQLNLELERTVDGILHLRELTPRSKDYLISFGERMSAPIFAAALQSTGLKARAFTGAEAGITTDENFGEAKPLVEVSYHQLRQSLEPVVSRREIPVVTGFIGATVEGNVTTFGRGGSDYTASLLGAALGADEIWIWTDVDGLMTADPRIAKDAKVLHDVSFGEALELSYFGAKMMHPRALQPAVQRGIPVRIKNSAKPTKDGTLISVRQENNSGKVVKAVSIIRSVGIVTVSGTGMMGAPGVAAKVFQTLGSNNVNVMMISQGSSEATISCVVARKDAEKAVRALQLALLGQGYVEKVAAEKDACVIAVVGAEMKGTPGVAARIFAAVAQKRINVRMVAQGSSEYNVSFVVPEGQGPVAVRAIHEEFKLAD